MTSRAMWRKKICQRDHLTAVEEHNATTGQLYRVGLNHCCYRNSSNFQNSQLWSWHKGCTSTHGHEHDCTVPRLVGCADSPRINMDCQNLFVFVVLRILRKGQHRTHTLAPTCACPRKHKMPGHPSMPSVHSSHPGKHTTSGL